jgi:hypothetical protein
MGHDASKIQMGSVGSNHREVSNKKGSIAAGKVVRLKSDGTISTALADGSIIGMSVGKDLSNTDRTSYVNDGLMVPVRLKTGFTNPAIGAQVAIDDTTGEAVAYTGSGNSYVNATYASGAKTRVDEDGTETATGAAYIDMQGGL